MATAKLEENEEPVEHVYLCTNGRVMAFDKTGQQPPAFQGRITEVLPKLMALPDAEHIQWIWMNYRESQELISFAEVRSFAEMLSDANR